MNNPADNIRNRFAWNGSVAFEYVKSQFPGEQDPFVRVLTTALNTKNGGEDETPGVIEGDEYVSLLRLSPGQKALLDDLRQKSPRFARFKHLAGQVLADCKNDAACTQKKEDAKQGIATGQWGYSINILPNLAEQRESLELAIQLMSFDPALVTGFGYVDGTTALPDPSRYPVRGSTAHRLFQLYRGRFTESFAAFNDGRRESEAGNHNAAVEHYRRAAALDPIFYHELGREFLQLGRWDEGTRMIDRYVKCSEKPYWALVETVGAFEHAANTNGVPEMTESALLENAVRHYMNAVELNPNQADLFFHIGDNDDRLKKYSDAVSAYSQAISLDPGNTIYHYRLGLAYQQLDGKNDDVITQLEKALELGFNPGLNQAKAACHFWLGRAYAEKPDYPKAVEHFKASMRYNPGMVGVAGFHAAKALMASQDYAGAIPHLKRAIELPYSIGFSELYANLGTDFARLGRKSEAIAALRQAFISGNDDVSDRHLLAQLLKETGAYREALDHAKVLVDEDPDNPSYLLLYGSLIAATGDLIVAEVALRKVFDKQELFNQLGTADRERLATTLERILRRRGKNTEADAVRQTCAERTLGVEKP